MVFEDKVKAKQQLFQNNIKTHKSINYFHIKDLFNKYMYSLSSSVRQNIKDFKCYVDFNFPNGEWIKEPTIINGQHYYYFITTHCPKLLNSIKGFFTRF